ncbi:MAG: HypC/HybG/HupF family hydrogenase formation chaperone [Deltaproteobacteria bacterium]|nr:HypC/HybG/HupF family hydrogenase formation chaperone [Deltaproteobacteria bacterium]
MCIGIPMRLVRIEGDSGVVESGGLEVRISLALLADPAVGDHVLVHAGFALEKLDEKEAEETLALLRQIVRLGGEQ